MPPLCSMVNSACSKKHKSACRSRVCRAHGKIYTLPRLYSPAQCKSFSSKPGFTQRASCAPFVTRTQKPSTRSVRHTQRQRSASYSKRLTVGRVQMLSLPSNGRHAWRWITRKRPDGRYYARAPKTGVAIKRLSLKRDADFGPERLLPASARRRSNTRRSGRRHSS